MISGECWTYDNTQVPGPEKYYDGQNFRLPPSVDVASDRRRLMNAHSVAIVGEC